MTNPPLVPFALPLTARRLKEPMPYVMHAMMPKLSVVQENSPMDHLTNHTERVTMYEFGSYDRKVHFLYGAASDGTTYTYCWPEGI